MLKNHICLCAWLGWEGTSVRGADWRGSLACLAAGFWLLEESLIKALKLQIPYKLSLACYKHYLARIMMLFGSTWFLLGNIEEVFQYQLLLCSCSYMSQSLQTEFPFP